MKIKKIWCWIWGLSLVLPVASWAAAPPAFVWENFELGQSYWGTQFEGSVMTDAVISLDFPSNGKNGFRGHFQFPAGGGRAAFSTSQAGDLTGGTFLTVDLYNASPLTLTAQFIIKQGPQWTWHQMGPATVKPGWNKDVAFDLTKAVDEKTGKSIPVPLSELHQVALVFETKEAGEGYLYMDHLRLAGADPEKVVMVRAEEMATGSAVTITGFEDNASPLMPDTGYSSALGTSVETAKDAPEGTRVARLSYDNKQADEKASFTLEADMDLTKISGVVYDVYNPLKEAVDTGIFVNTGSNWTYFESSSTVLQPGWNRDVTLSLKAKTFKSEASNWTNNVGVSGLSVARKLGFMFASHQIAKSYFLVDNLRFLSQDPDSVKKMVNDLFPQAPVLTGTDHLLEGFEGGQTAWAPILGSSKAMGSSIVPQKNATEGTHVWKADFEFDANSQQAWFGIEQEMNLNDSSAIKADIYNPNASPLQAAIVMKLGETYDWTESKTILVKPGWNLNVTFPLKAKTFKNATTNWVNRTYAEPLNQTKSLYLGFLSTGALKGSAYIDNIRMTGETAVKQKAAAPKRELAGRSILWDPLISAAADGWGADSSVGGNSFAVVSEYTKFEGANAVILKYHTVNNSQKANYPKKKPADWSNVLAAQFDFYNPQSYTVNFSLAVQTGPDSEWQETTEFSLKPGWNRKVRVDITQPLFKSLQTNWSSTDFMRDRHNIRAVIVSINPNHAGDGQVVMTNLRTIERDLIGDITSSREAGSVIGLSSNTKLTVRALKYTILEGFEAGVAQWQPSASALLSSSADYASEGSRSLRIDCQGSYVPGGAVPEIRFQPFGILDLMPYTQVQFDVYNPGPPISINLAFVTGIGNEWIESGSVTLGSGWNHNLSIPLTGNNFKSAATAWKMWDTFRNADQVSRLHMKFSNVSERGTLYLDNIRLVGSGNQKVDGILGETLGLKCNPSDHFQLLANGTILGTTNGPAQFSLDKVRVDVQGLGNELSIFAGDQLSGTDDPMQILSGAQLGNWIFGVDERYNVLNAFMVQASAFVEQGDKPYSLGDTSGYLLRLKSTSVNDMWIGASLLCGQFGNELGSNPLTADIEADVKTYEVDINGYIRELRLQFQGELAQSYYQSWEGGPYDLQDAGKNGAYYALLSYQLGAFKLQGTRMVHEENFFCPFSGKAYTGCEQNSAEITWQMDTLSLVKDAQQWSPFWGNFLTDLKFQAQYYDYYSLTGTYKNQGLRAILNNNNYKPPLFMNFWWYFYDEGHDVGDPALPNPSIPDHALIITSNYELHYQITPKFIVTGIFRDSFSDYWETFTWASELKWKFWQETWLSADAKFVTSQGSRTGQYTNFSAGLTRYLLGNTATISLTYGGPSFMGYWKDDYNMKTLDQWTFSLNAKF